MSAAPPTTITDAGPITISVVQDASDFLPFFNVCARSFGDQIQDAIWTAISPGWDTETGRQANADRFVKRWQTTKPTSAGDPSTVFLKATVPDPDRPGGEHIVGVATWAQLSFAPGWGNPPSTELGGTDDIFPDEKAARLARQIWASLMKPRVATVRAKEGDEVPAVFVLDLCAVDPDFQRRGIASKLVRWGLDEAARRGGLEATTEASVMGRWVYKQLGFVPVKEIEYEVDGELLGSTVLPSNLFMRTRP
ncbi:hypothetical protein M406DRAFT_291895 [Cryphonectria parasitica EP155]|uniref:N-acetyltransferase domain-containing protein n=1 Tax=Cryphonectria parasitica (strain ATCC 38755 / EP155) TaxID=660469 RepID=A0A9P4Y1A8_CRYP1|nr:uncharacterized protein M406DRAFT_291895 [Cryphonectria parasitica EP155]KAF3764731.1 hypothetical protein M406DRAFT_291895 [Cryphonectria parasitica EP155]